MSHYDEKARWALDYKRVAHRRRDLVPGFHVARLLWTTGQRQVPVLELHGEFVCGSDAIIERLERDYPDVALYPENANERQRAFELTEFFDDELGPYLSRALLHAILPDAGYCTALFAHGCSTAFRWFYRALFPAVRALMRHDMQIDAMSAEEAFEKTVLALNRIDRLLGTSGYLIGNRFTVADLTAAALLSPLAQPPEFPYAFPPVSAAVERLRERIGHRRVFEWCAQIYRRHRAPSAEVGVCARAA